VPDPVLLHVVGRSHDHPVTATDPDGLHPSDDDWRRVISAGRHAEIFDHATTVNLDWWKSSLSERGLPSGPVTGLSAASAVVDSGRQVITRGHVFGD